MELLLESGQEVRADADVITAMQGRALTWTPEGVSDVATASLLAPTLRPGPIKLRNDNPLDLRRANLETDADRALITITAPNVELRDRADRLAPILTLLALHDPEAPAHLTLALPRSAGMSLASLLAELNAATTIALTPDVALRAVLVLLRARDPLTLLQAALAALPRALPAPRMEPLESYPWRDVDWGKSDTEIAQDLGAARGTVYKARQRYADGALMRTGGGEPLLDWASVDWSKSDAQLAHELGRARGTVWHQRQRHAPHTLEAPTPPEPDPPARDLTPVQAAVLAILEDRAAINQRVLIRRASEATSATLGAVLEALAALADLGLAEPHPEHPHLWRTPRD